MELLGLSTKWFDNQTDIFRDLGLIIKPFDNQASWHIKLIDDQVIWLFRLQNVYSQIKEDRLKPLSEGIWQPPPPHPSSYQVPTTGVSCICHHHLWRLLCRHKSVIWYWLMTSMCLQGPCPWFFSWEHHAVFQMKKRLALSRLQMQGNHGSVSTSEP